MAKIKEFIKNGAIAAVEADAETATRLLVEKLGAEIEKFNEKYYFTLHSIFLSTKSCALSFWDIHLVEKAVIEKVGASTYGWHFMNIVKVPGNEIHEDIATYATASAMQKVAAMLSALSEVE